MCNLGYLAKIWNSLPDSVVNAESINAFKNRLDRLWSNQDVLYDYRANINTGSQTVHIDINMNNNEESSIEDPETEPALETNSK